MSSRHGAKRTREAERIASQAWEQLVSRVDSTVDNARSVRRRAANLATDAQHKVEATAEEARWRANAALDALSGRRPPRPWGAFAIAAAIGAVLSFITAAIARRALATSQPFIPDDLSDPEDVRMTTSPIRS
jgi:ElaB/YqjD/DUF883 family membrane-anchored ribosome-binding protein